MSYALLYDATLCTGCKQCERVCAQKNKLPYNDEIASEPQSEHKYTVIEEIDGKFMRKLCLHCLRPACGCVRRGIRRLPEGPVIYDIYRCDGLGACLQRCPFRQISYGWRTAPARMKKCEMCSDWVKKGFPTACASICPTGATKFGDRDALLAEAKERIRQSPDKYVNHIYGETEAGGTSVLLLSSVPFENFGWPTEEKLANQPQLR